MRVRALVSAISLIAFASTAASAADLPHREPVYKAPGDGADV